MSEHMFGVGKGEVSKAECRRVEKAARAVRSDVAFTCVFLRGTGWQHWFSGPNRGEPFDRQMADEVLAAVGSIRVKRRARRAIRAEGMTT